MLAEASYWVTWFPGALLAFLGVATLGYKGLRTFVKVSDAVPRLLEVADAMPTLLSAAAELRNNGGQSVKDSVDHIKREQARQARVQDAANRTMVQHIADDKDAFARIEGKP